MGRSRGAEVKRLLSTENLERATPDGFLDVMHPGPMNRGEEIGYDVAGDERSLVLQQVSNGVTARLAVLFRLLGGTDDA
jgi:aspartate carbamoyltransferase catalytic subunit